MDSEAKAMLARIDERTERMDDALQQHINNDRDDFKEVHIEIGKARAYTSKVERRQLYALGSLSVITALAVSWLKGVFTGSP